MSISDLPGAAAAVAARATVRTALRLVPRVEQPTLDPDLRRVARLFGMARAHTLPVGLLRRSYETDGRLWAARRPGDVQVTDETITVGPDATGGARRLRVRTYTPATGGEAAMMYVHGGGFSIGSIGSHDHVCRTLATTSGVVLQSVEYRLAPELPFPAGLTDILQLWAVLQRRWVDGGGDPDRYGVGGDSAGGHAGAVVADEATEPTLGVEVPMPAFTWLVYPASETTLCGEEMRDVLPAGGLLSGPMVARFTAMHVGDGPRTAPALNPGARADAVLAAHPRTWIQTVGFDPLREQGSAYAERLASLGVEVRHEHEPTMAHGYVSMGGVSPGAAAVLRRAAIALRDLATS